MEALLYLCAAGLGPEHLTMFFVDVDGSNGNLTQTREVAGLYGRLQAGMVGAGSPAAVFKTRVALTNPDYWNPLERPGQTLSNFFGIDALRADPQLLSTAHLLDVLYSRREHGTDLDKGFRGRPSIGAAVFGARVELAEGAGTPWVDIGQQISASAGLGADIRLFLFGSIFGGTGAAGFPTFAQLIRTYFQSRTNPVHAACGGALLLPYFSFNPNPAKLEKDELYADPGAFLSNSRAALSYYARGISAIGYDRLYLLGMDTARTQDNFELGGREQKNGAHVVELLAALGALDFFNSDTLPANWQAIGILARDQPNSFEWSDLPPVPRQQGQQDQADGHKSPASTQERIKRLARMCAAYSYILYPEIHRRNFSKARTPWYVDLLGEPDSEAKKALASYKDFSDKHLKWLGELHVQDSKAFSVNLFNAAGFKDQPAVEADGLNFVYGEQAAWRYSANNVWRRFCDAAPVRPRATGFGPFIGALHEICE